MSYWVYLMMDTGGSEPATVADVGNMTSNCSGMWAKALGKPLAELDGLNAGEQIAILEKAVLDMRDNPLEYEGLEPSNGWGDLKSAKRYLNDLLSACQQNPKAFIYISH